MAGASDKARFYLERSVPELQELQRKDIFTKQEVLSIVKKRSDFEHKLNARGSHPSDYAKYAEYEMNLETLRRKRAKRLGVKVTNHSGQRRIFFVLERATKKFHGDTALWMQYVSFARKQKSHTKVSEILAQMVRLLPTKPEIWIYAAKYAMEEKGDMTEARGYMQKGLRFCKRSEELWIEYARLEMIYIAKLAARSKILGLDQPERVQKGIGDGNEGMTGDAMALHEVTAGELNHLEVQDGGSNQEALEKHNAASARSESIPMAIFDAALTAFKNDNNFAWKFFDMVAEFDVATSRAILDHIMHDMLSKTPDSPQTLIRWVREPLIGLHPTALEFPISLGTSLDRLKAASQKLKTAQCRQAFQEGIVDWATGLLEVHDLDPDIRRVLQITQKKSQDQSGAIEA